MREEHHTVSSLRAKIVIVVVFGASIIIVVFGVNFRWRILQQMDVILEKRLITQIRWTRSS